MASQSILQSPQNLTIIEENFESTPTLSPMSPPSHRSNDPLYNEIAMMSSIDHPSKVNLSSFFKINWTRADFIGSWALDPSNPYGVNSSQKIRKMSSESNSNNNSNNNNQFDGQNSTVCTCSSSTSNINTNINASYKNINTNNNYTNTCVYHENIELLMYHVSCLSNHVTQKASLQFLRQMKAQSQYSHLFSSSAILFETFKLLSSYTYKLPARRFLLFDLFNTVYPTLPLNSSNSASNQNSLASFDQPFLAENISSADRSAIRHNHLTA
jgi:hypothetical protein